MTAAANRLAQARRGACESFGTGHVDSPTEPCTPVVPRLRLHVDADRDGIVDDRPSGGRPWTAGRRGRGAIILVNNDADNGQRTLDNRNEVVDGQGDRDDLMPLVVRRTPLSRQFPFGYRARLRVSETKIRIFDAAGNPIIDPRRGVSWETGDLSWDEQCFQIEALEYASRGFDGFIELTLTVSEPSGRVVDNDSTVVRVAPWMMMHELLETEEILVTQLSGGQNAQFIQDVRRHAASINVRAYPNVEDDRWIQDVMEIGFSGLPRVGTRQYSEMWNMPVVMRTPSLRDRDGDGSEALALIPRNNLLGPGFGYFAPVSLLRPEADLDGTGNLECSPPVTVRGRRYDFGRIVYGVAPNRTDPALRLPDFTRFLISQRVQEPFCIDTGWLLVGHVDEVLSFCPAPQREKGFVIVLPSPDVGMGVLRRLRDSGHGSAPMRISYRGSNGFGAYQTTPGAMLNLPSAVRFQSLVQRKMDELEQVLRVELGMTDPADVIRLPVLFGAREWDGSAELSTATACTSNVVNMLVVTASRGAATLLMPKTFGPHVNTLCQFEQEILDRLRPLGHVIRFVDAWQVYHLWHGEVHCGTNSKRKPPTDRWWWNMDWLNEPRRSTRGGRPRIRRRHQT